MPSPLTPEAARLAIQNAKAAKWRAANRAAWRTYSRDWKRQRRKAERQRLGRRPTAGDRVTETTL